MTNIFLDKNNKLLVSTEVEYINYLTSKVFEDFYSKIVTTQNIKKLKTKYQISCTEANCILIPKSIENLNFSERQFLKNPRKVLKNLKIAEKYFYVYKISEASLLNLDLEFSEIFNSNIHNTQDKIVILNNQARLSQYQEIIYGLDSKKFIYNSTEKFYQYFIKELKSLYKQDSKLKDLIIYYTIGSTAVSLKSLSIKF